MTNEQEPSGMLTMLEKISIMAAHLNALRASNPFLYNQSIRAYQESISQTENTIFDQKMRLFLEQQANEPILQAKDLPPIGLAMLAQPKPKRQAPHFTGKKEYLNFVNSKPIRKK